MRAGPTATENRPVRRRTICAAMAAALLGATVLCGHTAAISGPDSAPKTHAVPPPDARVDINCASLEELMRIPGMTRSWAGRIMRFRPYRTKADLVEHGVVTSEVYARIKDYIIAHREKE